MSQWQPKLPNNIKIQYKQLADALAQDIEAGVLAPGYRLPNIRALAKQLNATTTTISRAYAEAEKRHLIRSQVGKGTFVAGQDTLSQVIRPAVSTSINLSIIQPVVQLGDEAFQSTLKSLGHQPIAASMMQYPNPAGELRHRQAGLQWLQYLGVEANSPDQVLLTTGAQHALLTVISGLTNPGDKIAVEALCYPGIQAIADNQHRELVGIPMDEHGLLPEAFELACQQHTLRMLILVTSCHNPTTATMPERRRAQVAEIAKRYRVLLIDDDIYSFITRGNATPLYNLAPELTCTISSLSKAVMPGLRAGYIYAPPALTEALASTIRTSIWMASPLSHEVAARLIEQGHAAEISQRQVAEAEARQKIARTLLSSLSYQSQRYSYHGWLSLPQPWTAEQFQRECQQRGVLISSAVFFATNRYAVPPAVRLSLMSPESREQLSEGLKIIRDILQQPAATQISAHF